MQHYGLTANARKLSSVSPNDLPLGTKVYVVGVQTFKDTNLIIVTVVSRFGLRTEVASKFKNYRIAKVPFEMLQIAAHNGVRDVFPLSDSSKLPVFKQIINAAEKGIKLFTQGDNNGNTEASA